MDNYKQFVDEIFNEITTLGVDTSGFIIDHVGYLAADAEDYEKMKIEFGKLGENISENIVGGRRVGIFKLNNPLLYKGQLVGAIEVFEPRPGQNIKSGLEHVEIIVPSTLEDLLEKYKTLNWETYALNRDEFPQLILPLNNGVRVKFPRRGILEEIERQKKTS